MKEFSKKTKCGLLMAAVTVSVAFSGCGTDDGDLSVSINDGYCTTIITANAGETVASVLSRAEITLSEDDESVPQEEEAITDENTTIIINRYAGVTLTDGEVTVSLELNGATVSDAIEKAGITLGENDTVNYSPDAYLTDGMEIEIEHWYEVLINISGEEQTVITQAGTVEDVLAEQGITLAADDRVEPELNTAINSDGLEIEIQYVSTREVTEETEIEYETLYEDSDTLYVGETQVAQEGQKGILTTTYTVTYVDGVEESRTVSKEEVTQEAVDEIILVGTKEEEPEPEPEPESESEAEPESESETQESSGPKVGDIASDGRVVIAVGKEYDCDGSGNGYYIIEYDDGSIEYEDFYDPDFW